MPERFAALAELTKARFREFYREPEAVFWTFGFPVILAVVLGLAFRSQPVAPARVAVAPGEPAWLRDALSASESVEVLPLEGDEAARKLRTGALDLVVSADAASETPRVVYRLDPTRPEARAAQILADDVLQRALGRTDAVESGREEVTETGSRYVDFLFPGLLGINAMMSSLWGIGYTIVLHRKRKLLKRLAATPMRTTDLLLSYFLSRLVFLVAELGAILGFGVLAFGIEVRGSLAAVGLLGLLGASAFGTLALFVASRADTIESANGWLNFVSLPMWLLSGSFYSYERFPEVFHPAIQALPLTALNDALRAVMNEGAALSAVLPEMGVLAVWTALGFLLGKRAFRW